MIFAKVRPFITFNDFAIHFYNQKHLEKHFEGILDGRNIIMKIIKKWNIELKRLNLSKSNTDKNKLFIVNITIFMHEMQQNKDYYNYTATCRSTHMLN